MTGRYRYHVANLNTGEVLDEVRFSSMKWSQALRKPGGWDATVGIADPKARGTLLSVANRAVWITRDNVALAGGPAWVLDGASSKATVKIGGQGILSYYRDRRTVRGIDGMTHATLDGNMVQWDAVDSFNIVSDLIDHAHAFTGGDLGLQVAHRGPATDGLAGVTPVGIETNAQERRYIGTVFDDVADLDAASGGFDYAVDLAYVDGRIVPTLSLHYPRRGRRRGDVVLDRSNANIRRWRFDGEAMANLIHGQGSGSADEMTVVERTDAALIYPEGSYPLLEHVEKFTDTDDTDFIGGTCDELLEVLGLPPTSIELELDHDRLAGKVNTGDEIRVVFNEGFLNLATYYRILTLGGDIDQDGSATMNLTGGLVHIGDVPA